MRMIHNKRHGSFMIKDLKLISYSSSTYSSYRSKNGSIPEQIATKNLQIQLKLQKKLPWCPVWKQNSVCTKKNYSHTYMALQQRFIHKGNNDQNSSKTTGHKRYKFRNYGHKRCRKLLKIIWSMYYAIAHAISEQVFNLSCVGSANSK